MFVKIFNRKQNYLFNFSLCKFLKRQLCTNPDSVRNTSTKYQYLLILDFEATCDRKKMNQEIIEFPCLKINLQNMREEERFHQYVKPIINPILTNFCVDLTGILQETVNEAKTFPEVYKMFEEWRNQENLTSENSLYITSGDWDLGHMLPHQCAISQIEVPSHMKIWIDIKKLFGHTHDVFHLSFSDIMKHYKLEFKGRQHSGIDDCLNMLQVVREMKKEGVEFRPTSKIYNSKPEVVSDSFKPPKKIKMKPDYYYNKRKAKLKEQNQDDEIFNKNSDSSEKISV